MINFVNTFLSYALLLLVTVVLAGIAVTIGIILAKKKSAASDKEASEEIKEA